MPISKVYLAKSNQANPNLVSRVRQFLSLYEVEVLEYKGGTYSDDMLLSSDFLVVVPYIQPNGRVVIGKGLYHQIETFKKEKEELEMFVISSDSRVLVTKQINKLYVMNETDYISYGELTFKGSEDKLSTRFEYDFDIPFKIIKNEELVDIRDSNYYVLIGRK